MPLTIGDIKFGAETMIPEGDYRQVSDMLTQVKRDRIINVQKQQQQTGASLSPPKKKEEPKEEKSRNRKKGSVSVTRVRRPRMALAPDFTNILKVKRRKTSLQYGVQPHNMTIKEISDGLGTKI
mmetsp:Transcript_1299/g.1612  ORF Transcript_1299/g.1612 Transcript_1299/m.1612 type:complete len:124 (-) Transcript_1299:868-1239(-)